MKGSLVTLKNRSNDVKTGIVMSDPWRVPKHTHDFLDGYRQWEGEESSDPADHRMTVYAVEVYWPDTKKTRQHRLNELDFLHLKR